MMGAAEKADLYGVLGAAARRVRRRRGVGDAAAELRAIPLPGTLERYLATGAPMGTLKRDLGAATAQIPRWAYGVGAALAILIAARSYTKWRDEK